jgi:hypothetical protein
MPLAPVIRDAEPQEFARLLLGERPQRGSVNCVAGRETPQRLRRSLTITAKITR